MHWTQTPEGRAKMGKRIKKMWKQKRAVSKIYKKSLTPSNLLTILDSAWNNLTTPQKIQALASMIRQEKED